jgi:hypothetical protein
MFFLHTTSTIMSFKLNLVNIPFKNFAHICWNSLFLFSLNVIISRVAVLTDKSLVFGYTLKKRKKHSSVTVSEYLSISNLFIIKF